MGSELMYKNLQSDLTTLNIGVTRNRTTFKKEQKREENFSTSYPHSDMCKNTPERQLKNEEKISFFSPPKTEVYPHNLL